MKSVVIGGTGRIGSTAVGPVPDSDTDLAARFVRDAMPLVDVLSRGARRLTRNDADAEDLLQDTLLHAYAGFHSFREGTNLKAWLFRILHNRWVSTHRYKQRRPAEVSVEDVGEGDLFVGTPQPTAGLRPAEAEVVDVLPDNEIKAALATLPEGTGEVMYYACVQGYTYAETAELMNIPVGTVMSRVSRGRKRMRIALAHLDHGRAEDTTAEQHVA